MRSDEPIAYGLASVRRLASADPTALSDREETIAAIDGLRAALEARPSTPSTARLHARLGEVLGALRGCTAPGSAIPSELVGAARACLVPVPLAASGRPRSPSDTARPLAPARALAVGGGGRDDAYPGDVVPAIQRVIEDLHERSAALLVMAIDVRGQLLAASGSIEPETSVRLARLGKRIAKPMRAGDPRATVIDEDDSGIHLERVGALLVIVLFDSRRDHLATHALAAHEELSRILAASDPFPPFDERDLDELFGPEDGDRS